MTRVHHPPAWRCGGARDARAADVERFGFIGSDTPDPCADRLRAFHLGLNLPRRRSTSRHHRGLRSPSGARRTNGARGTRRAAQYPKKAITMLSRAPLPDSGPKLTRYQSAAQIVKRLTCHADAPHLPTHARMNRQSPRDEAGKAESEPPGAEVMREFSRLYLGEGAD